MHYNKIRGLMSLAGLFPVITESMVCVMLDDLTRPLMQTRMKAKLNIKALDIDRTTTVNEDLRQLKFLESQLRKLNNINGINGIVELERETQHMIAAVALVCYIKIANKMGADTLEPRKVFGWL